jgi:hypothetical protein
MCVIYKWVHESILQFIFISMSPRIWLGQGIHSLCGLTSGGGDGGAGAGERLCGHGGSSELWQRKGKGLHVVGIVAGG